jgi:hypothetical protein
MWPVVVGAPGAAAVQSTYVRKLSENHFYFWMRWLAVCTINSSYTRT